MRFLALLILAALARGQNVLFVMADDLTAEALGCYGNLECHTPNLDRLAKRGLVFDRAYCAFPVCGPSRAALMSGLQPHSSGVMGNGGSAKWTEKLEGRPTLPQYLRQEGWRTARVGKIYHMLVPGNITAGVDGPDHTDSWDERFNAPGLEWMTAGRFEHLSHETLKWKLHHHYGLGFGTAFYAVESFGDGSDQADARATETAIRWLHEREEEQPFFLAVGYVRPHVPLVAPASIFARYDASSLTLAGSVPDDQADIPAAGISLNTKRIGASAAEQRRILRAYYASVTFLDEQVGRLLDTLDELGLTDDTWIVFKSDHGYHLGEHDLWQKLSLHEESARIPLLLAGPGIPTGRRGALVEQVDLYPTLANLAGLEVPEHCEGIDLAPVIERDTAVREGALCVTRKGQLWRTLDHAYMRYDEGGYELYDMNADPRQFTNLAETSEELRARLDAALEARLAELR